MKFEPRIALSGGYDGLDFYRRIIKNAGAFLKPNGLLVLEFGINQSIPIVNFALDTRQYDLLEIRKDYGGIERAVVLRYGKMI